MNKIAELTVQILFLILSVVAAILPSGFYINHEAWVNLYLTNIINGFIAAFYLLARFLLRNKNSLEGLQRAMLLVIIYSCLPVFVLISNPITRILSSVCFIGALVVFILKNVYSRDAELLPKIMSRDRLIFSILLLLFSAGFFVRGVTVIYRYVIGVTEIMDMLVSLSDIIICLIWGITGVGFMRSKVFGDLNILPCFIQASLLFIGLIIFLVINPLVIDTPIDMEAVIVITGMSLFFFIPTIILLKKISWR